MAGSRRKLKRSRAKVKVGLPKKHPNVFKPAFNMPPKLVKLLDLSDTHWDDQASVIKNYKTFGVVSNPNFLGVRSRNEKIMESDALQAPPPKFDGPVSEFEPIDSGSDVEEDDLKSALGKKRRDGKTLPLLPLTKMQRVHIAPLVEKYGDDYQSMFRDTKLNKMQHSVATLEKLCARYVMWKNQNPLLVGGK
ncbi:hypothetical protein ACET3Z_002577 [Daucus carota]